MVHRRRRRRAGLIRGRGGERSEVEDGGGLGSLLYKTYPL